jgi:cell fate regulator YaaT (PSP1 superfamily)
MACKSCSSGGCGSKVATDGKVGGCQNNGACSTGGCNKMNVFDWLSDMDIPTLQRFDVIEVKFKGGRKEYYKNINKLDLYTGDPVIVDVPNGHHMGYVSLQGELVRLQMLKRSVKNDDTLRTIYRKANEKDLEKFEQAVARDLSTMYRTRELIKEFKINMKLSDVEFQADNSKATFYYSSEDRVDFRELIKNLAGEFKVRVEMKQISLRQEAGRIGGIGVCGRELCCSTWLTDFKNVNTSAARYQNLSLNPTKLSGQCGRLKCCLNYELETYMDALKDIPTINERITIARGQAFLQKTDIFRKLMWFSFDKDDNWYPVPVARVVEIMELNKKGIVPASFDEMKELKDIVEAKPTAINSDLAKLDQKYATNKNKKKPSGQGNREQGPRENRPKGEFTPRPPRPAQNQTQRPNPTFNPNQTPKQSAPINADIDTSFITSAENVQTNSTPNPNKKKKKFKKRPPRPDGGAAPLQKID